MLGSSSSMFPAIIGFPSVFLLSSSSLSLRFAFSYKSLPTVPFAHRLGANDLAFGAASAVRSPCASLLTFFCSSALSKPSGFGLGFGLAFGAPPLDLLFAVSADGPGNPDDAGESVDIVDDPGNPDDTGESAEDPAPRP